MYTDERVHSVLWIWLNFRCWLCRAVPASASETPRHCYISSRSFHTIGIHRTNIQMFLFLMNGTQHRSGRHFHSTVHTLHMCTDTKCNMLPSRGYTSIKQAARNVSEWKKYGCKRQISIYVCYSRCSSNCFAHHMIMVMCTDLCSVRLSMENCMCVRFFLSEHDQREMNENKIECENE